MPIKRPVIKTQRELCEWIFDRLGDKWRISVEESFQTEIDNGSRSSDRVNRFTAYCNWHNFDLKIYISASVTARTFAALVRRVVDGELWTRIKDAFERYKAEWTPPVEAIENPQLALTGPQANLEHSMEN